MTALLGGPAIRAESIGAPRAGSCGRRRGSPHEPAHVAIIGLLKLRSVAVALAAPRARGHRSQDRPESRQRRPSSHPRVPGGASRRVTGAPWSRGVR